MKHKSSKLLSILLAFVMVAGLLPLGQVAYAYSEGDIPGTTGTGTVSDPIMVDNFTELRAACGLATFETDLYIKFENKTVEETLPFDAPSLTSAIRLNTGYVHLILDGSYVFKANHIDKALYGHFFEVASGGFLEISGNGKLSFSPMLTGATNAVILVSGGTVEINSGHLDGHPLNWAVWGRAISYRTGKLTINGGTFTGYNDQSNPDSVDAVAITPPSSASGNFVKINGGTFSSSSKNTPTEGCFGLSVWGTSTFNKYEVIKLAGGIFDGIEVNVGEAKIGDILEEGYHTYYAGSGNIAPAIEALKASTEKIKIDKNTYTIYFDRNGGTGEMSSVTVNKNDSYTIPACGFTAPSGMAFQNWYLIDYDANALMGEKNPTDSITVDRNLKLQANWDVATPITYNVTVSNDGNGTGSASPTFGPTGTVVNLTATPNSGYELLGWQVVSGGVTIMGDKFTIGTKDVEVKAIFGLIPATTYEVTFDANGGGGTMTPNPVTVNAGEKLTLPECTFTPPTTDKEFDKWEAGNPGEQVEITSDCVIRAIWKDKSLTPTAPTITTSALPGGKVGTAYNQTLAATGDTPITWTVESGTMPTGLSLGTDGTISGTPSAAGTYTFAVKATNGAGSNTKSFTVKIAAADATTYTVSFNANSGGGTMADMTVIAGEKLTLPECAFTPPSTDKEFDKWDAGNPGDKVDITSDCTITAIWKDKTVVPTTYTVTFKDGENTLSTATVNSGEKVTKPADPTKTGYTFNGWYADATFTAAFDFDQPITANTTVYAKFTENSVTPPATITYTVTGGGNSTWTKGSSSTVTITVKRSEDDANCFTTYFDHVVEIDGTALAASDYEAKEGSTVVTLKAATLQKLSTGNHTVTVKFKDGEASTGLTIKAASGSTDKPTSPKTGDESNLHLWVILMLMSILGFIATVAVGRKKRQHSR